MLLLVLALLWWFWPLCCTVVWSLDFSICFPEMSCLFQTMFSDQRLWSFDACEHRCWPPHHPKAMCAHDASDLFRVIGSGRWHKTRVTIDPELKNQKPGTGKKRNTQMRNGTSQRIDDTMRYKWTNRSKANTAAGNNQVTNKWWNWTRRHKWGIPGAPNLAHFSQQPTKFQHLARKWTSGQTGGAYNVISNPSFRHYDCIIWHGDHRERQKYWVVRSQPYVTQPYLGNRIIVPDWVPLDRAISGMSWMDGDPTNSLSHEDGFK